MLVHVEEQETYALNQPPEIVLKEQDEIQEIIGHPPSWILRWGILAISIVVSCLLFLSWFIKYPDVLPAQVYLTTERPVLGVSMAESGKIEELLVEDRQEVAKGQVLAVLESGAKWADIKQLKAFVAKLDSTDAGTMALCDLAPPADLSIGPAQWAYTSLFRKVASQIYLLKQTSDYRKKAAALRQIEQYKNMNAILEEQLKLTKEEVAITEASLLRNQQLFEEKVINIIKYEDAKTNALQVRQDQKELESAIVGNMVSIENLNIQVETFTRARQQILQEYKTVIEDHSLQMKGEIAKWEKDYLLKAPIAGTISMIDIRSENQFVPANTEVFNVIPPQGMGLVVAKAWIPARGIGKVEAGMRANISLEGYPDQEYGVLSAHIEKLSLVPETMIDREGKKDFVYLAELSLPTPLKTTYGKEIPLRHEMPGRVEIITRERRILERVLDQLFNLIKN
ncbi:MAG: HlyD family efflux transporter periplasmic adaptor subunit [Bacteroidota bacterium]